MQYMFVNCISCNADILLCYQGIKGSHGRPPDDDQYKPVLIMKRRNIGRRSGTIVAEDVFEVLYHTLTSA